jgi:hypothetical protein
MLSLACHLSDGNKCDGVGVAMRGVWLTGLVVAALVDVARAADLPV